jgi:hypothetical protein
MSAVPLLLRTFGSDHRRKPPDGLDGRSPVTTIN